MTVPKTVRRWRDEERDDAPTGSCCPGSGCRCSGSWWKAYRRTAVNAARLVGVAASSGRTWRSVHGGCGAPVPRRRGGTSRPRRRGRGEARSGRGCDNDEPERDPGERRGWPAANVMRRCEPGGDVDVRGVDLGGRQLVDGDRTFARPGLPLEEGTDRQPARPASPTAVILRPGHAAHRPREQRPSRREVDRGTVFRNGPIPDTFTGYATR